MGAARLLGAAWLALLLGGCETQAVTLRAAAPTTADAIGPVSRSDAYSHSCLQCHGAKLEGGEFGPPLKGTLFQAKWQNQPSEALSQYIATRMPPSGPGSLSRREYAEIERYVRQFNERLRGTAQHVAAAADNDEVARKDAARKEEADRNAKLFSAAIDTDATYQATMAKRDALLAGLSAVGEPQLRNPSERDWLHWRRTYDALGYSPLAQIDRGNVATLRNVWSWSLQPSVNEITPLVHDGVMFIASGASVEALDAASGERLWQYLRVLPDEVDGGRGARAKSLAYLGDTLFAPTADSHIVALEAKTGKLLWDHEVIAPDQRQRKGESDGSPLRVDGGPLLAKGKVIVGVSLGVTHGRGGAYIVALDAKTGHESWRFNTIAEPGQPGGDSWNGHPMNERYGGGVWTPGSYDPDLNLVYFGTGNTYATATLLVPDPTERPTNLGLYTDSTVALDVDTGKLAWHYQHMSRDVWDLDWAFEQTLVDLDVGGKRRKLVLTGGKLALFDALDRTSGEYLYSRDLGLQNVVQSIEPATGRKIINPEVQPESGKTKWVCPYATAGRNWLATSFNPRSGILYVPLVESCMNHTFTPGSAAETAAGGVDARMEQRVRPDSDGKFGRLQALDITSGQVLWTERERATPSSAMLDTAGGVVFAGNHDRMFRAHDDQTGAVLWETRLNAPPSSFPITYSANGEQYVAVVAGGGNALEATRGTLTPEIAIATGNPVLFVFKLSR